MSVEFWKIIENHENYEVSRDGQVRNIHTSEILTPCRTGKYYYVYIDKTVEYIHKLVAVAFVPMEEGDNLVFHKNKDTYDNHYTNLRWSSRIKECKNNSESSNINYLKFKGFTVLCQETGQLFESIKSCAESINVNPGRLSRHIKKQTPLYGKIYKRITKDEVELICSE